MEGKMPEAGDFPHRKRNPGVHRPFGTEGGFPKGRCLRLYHRPAPDRGPGPDVCQCQIPPGGQSGPQSVDSRPLLCLRRAGVPALRPHEEHPLERHRQAGADYDTQHGVHHPPEHHSGAQYAVPPV